MSENGKQQAQNVLANLNPLLPDLESIYKDIHSHPELSMEENRTATIAADRLRAAGYEVTTGVGKTGVVGVLRNGDGPTIMLRADMNALPVREATGLPYASNVSVEQNGKSVPVMHACGHDMHVTWLIGVATLMANNRNAWRGTLMPLFQPAEETAAGAQAMIDDGLFKRFPKPSAILGQHVMVGSSGEIDLGGRLGVDLWNYRTPDGRSLRQGLDYLISFATGEKRWPHKQITAFRPSELHPVLRLAAIGWKDSTYRAIAQQIGGATPILELTFP